MARIIVITSGKGGVGKTTITAMLGKSLAKLKKKVALIDADLGLKNLDVIMGLESRVIYDFDDVKRGRASLKQALVRDKEYENLFLLPACLRTDQTAISTSDMEIVLNEMNSDFDYILIDSPAGIEKGFHQAIRYAKEVLLVVTLDKVSIKDADKVIGILHSEHLDNIQILVNRVPLKACDKDATIPIEEVERVLGKPILGYFYESHLIRKAQNKGLVLLDDHLEAYLDVASKICGEKRIKSPSLWKRIMKKAHLS